jgi:hypothetical protein
LRGEATARMNRDSGDRSEVSMVPQQVESGREAGRLDVLNLLLSLYPQVEVPGGVLAFVREQDANGHRIRRGDTGEPLRDFLVRIGVHRDVVSRFLDEDSRLVSELSYPSLLRSSLPELRTRLEEHFDVLFVLQQAVLDSELLTGFNRHDREHLTAVSASMLELLRAAERDVSQESVTEKEAAIAGYLHDCGNILARKYHGAYGVYLVSRFFSDVDRDQKTLSSFLRVLEAVLFHEVEIGLRLPSLTSLHPATLSLIIADKTDVSARRVSTKSNLPEAIRDAHTLVNLLTVHSHVGCEPPDFAWKLRFSPRAETDDVARFSHLLKQSERVWVPQAWQRLYREYNVEYLFVFHATFMQLYLSRLLYTIRAVFALYPDVEGFRLTIEDRERGISLSRLFGRGDYEGKIGLIGKNLFKQNWEQTYLCQSLAHVPRAG